MNTTTSKFVVSRPAYGQSPAGFPRLIVEMRPREVGRLIGYDPRVLVMKPKKATKSPRGTRDLVPANVDPRIVALANEVQRSIDEKRVATMVRYLMGALTGDEFADWGPIELATASKPDTSRFEDDGEVALDADADYFIADGQHRFCALLDLVKEHPELAEKFTQTVTISILPDNKLTEWAAQEFHDRNYYAVRVAAGKALATDSRDPVNSLARGLSQHPAIVAAGGIAMDRDTLTRGDERFATHNHMHRFVRAFLLGRPGLDRGSESRIEVSEEASDQLHEFFNALALVLPWSREDREEYLTRTSAVLGALGVIGHDLYFAEPPITTEEKVRKLGKLAKVNWRRDNLKLDGIIGSEKDGEIAASSTRSAIDSTVKFIREQLGIVRAGSAQEN